MTLDNPPPTPPNDPRTVPDPQLDALLDAVLAPETAPAELNERVLRATAPLVAARRQPVLGRIEGGFRRSALRVAAAVLIATGIIGLVALNTRPGPQVIPHELELVQLDTLNAAADATHRQAETIDLQIEAFALQVALADRADPWAESDAAFAAFDDLAFETQMDLLASDLESVF